jgi:hypothetical protein
MSGRIQDEDDAVMDEEIAWLRSFHWTDQAIADRFGIQVASLKRRGTRHTQPNESVEATTND